MFSLLCSILVPLSFPASKESSRLYLTAIALRSDEGQSALLTATKVKRENSYRQLKCLRYKTRLSLEENIIISIQGIKCFDEYGRTRALEK